MSAPSITSESPPSYTSQPANASELPSNSNANEISDNKSVRSESTMTSKVERRAPHSNKRRSTVSSRSSPRKEESLKLDTSDKATRSPHRRHSTLSTRQEKETTDGHVEQVRRSTYGPDFLKQLAEMGLSEEATDATGRGKFKVVMGSEAMSIYEDYVGTRDKVEDVSPKDEHKRGHAPKTPPQQPIVFAFTASDGARKVVDYYMTWKGKTRARHLKGPERKASFLDAEFNKVTEALDKEYKRLSVLSESPFESIPQPVASSPVQVPTEMKPELPTTDATSPAKPIPPPINPPQPSDTIEPARLSASSVVSLPLLNMIRGVPLGNRLPLFVTNPDPTSSSTTSSIRGSIVEAAGPGKDLSDALAGTLQQPKTPENSSSNDRYRPKKPSPLAVSRSPSENSGEDSSKSETSEKSRKGSRSASRSPASKSPSGQKGDNSSEILIVLVENEKDMEKEKEKSDHTWHGLERKLSRRSTKSSKSARPASGERYSPWLGPLIAADKVTIHPSRKPSRIGPLRKSSSPFPTDSSSSLSPSSDEDDDEDDDDDSWKGPTYPGFPVVPAFPIKSYLINEGLLPPESNGEKPVTTLPLNRATSVGTASVAGSVYSYHSPYVASIDVPSVAGSIVNGGYPRRSTPPYPAVNYAPYPPGAASMTVSMPMTPPHQGGQLSSYASTGSPIQAPGYISVASSPYMHASPMYNYLPNGFVPYH